MKTHRKKSEKRKSLVYIFSVLCLLTFTDVNAATKISSIDTFKARPPIHIYGFKTQIPQGMTPETVKTSYNLPRDGGQGTIAIIDAYHTPFIEHDLDVFSKQFSLVSCTIKNNCLEVHTFSPTTIHKNTGWAQETTLDVEWAHAIAPNAKILLVEANGESGKALLDAVDYARNRADVVAVSMSWGGKEFSTEESLDSHFSSSFGATFFAASGDSGSGTSWPSVSSKVISVGGTALQYDLSTKSVVEFAWSGSGGGVSKYIKEPTYQKEYHIVRNKGMRGIPDVSYNADPQTGFSIYFSGITSTISKSKKLAKTVQVQKGDWMIVGGTSAGAPQWAAIRSLGAKFFHGDLYAHKASSENKNYFRDIISGTNGQCEYFCQTRAHYDYVTGLGSPQTSSF